MSRMLSVSRLLTGTDGAHQTIRVDSIFQQLNKRVRNTVVALFIVATVIYFGFMYMMINAAGT